MKYFIPVALLVSFLFFSSCEAPPTEAIADAEHAREPDSQVLLTAMASRNREERVMAAVAMGRIQSASYAGALADAVGDEERAVRHAAIFALGQLGLVQDQQVPQQALEAVRATLESEEKETLALAIQALGKLAPADDVGTLATFLTNASPRVREEAAHALMRWRFTQLWRGEIEAARDWPDTVVQTLSAAQSDPDSNVRRAVAHAFSRYGEARALNTLAACSKDKDAIVRLHAARAVGRSGNPESADQIAWGLTDQDSRVRQETVAAIATLERQDLLPTTLAIDPALHVRGNLARALGDDTRQETIAILRTLEKDESSSVQVAAIGSLATRLGARYKADLLGHLKSPDWVLRAAAAMAATGLGVDGLAVLLASTEDSDPRVTAAALVGLEDYLQQEAAADAVRSALASDDLAVRGTALGLLESWPHDDRYTLLNALLDRSAGIRWVELRETLADMPAMDEPTIELLARVAVDSAPSVRSKARAALAKIDPDRTYPAVPVDEDVPPLPSREFKNNPVVILETTKGTMEIECFPKDAPVHVANFIQLVEKGVYDGLIWHRVVPNFVIQGGDPEGNGWGGPGYSIPDEINRKRYLTGAVGMPKGGKDTGGCQLFITHIPTPHLDGNYTVFGQVVSGLDVIDRIEVGDRIVRAVLK